MPGGLGLATEHNLAIAATQLHPDLYGELRQFIASVESADGVPALSEYKAMRLCGGLDAREHVVVNGAGSIVGYGQAAWHRGLDAAAGHWAIEVVVDPDHRDTRVVDDLIESLRLDAAGSETTLWSRAAYVGAAATRSRWAAQRTLLEMRRALPIPGARPDLPGFRVATFRIGVDEVAWLEANNAAFVGHPENGYVTRRDLQDRMAQSWFDPEGFFLAWDEDRLVGSCWTKVHDDGVGEIYIIGVVPGEEGRGIGRGLAAVALDYLAASKYVTEAMLYVEESNRRATQLYERLGFVTVGTVVAYRYAPKA